MRMRQIGRRGLISGRAALAGVAVAQLAGPGRAEAASGTGTGSDLVVDSNSPRNTTNTPSTPTELTSSGATGSGSFADGARGVGNSVAIRAVATGGGAALSGADTNGSAGGFPDSATNVGAEVSPTVVSPRFNCSVSVVLPAFNEEAVIEQTVRHVAEVMRGLVAEFEIIVTNDGSSDRTGAVLAALQHEPALPLCVVTHERNQGYGAALASGFDAARNGLIFMTDGDKQFDVAEIAGFIPAMDADTDLVIGWRRKRADPFMRLVNAWGWKQLVNGLFGYTARDVDCAFKLFRHEVWRSVVVHARGATFSAEFLIKSRRLGFQVKELPVGHFTRTAGSATGAKPTVIVRALRELFALWRTLDQQLANDSRERPAQGRAPRVFAI